MTNQTPAIGHNDPPSDAELLDAALTKGNADLEERVEKLLSALKRLPKSVDTEKMAERFSDFIKQFNDVIREAKARHKTAKAPFLEQGRVVDNFFKSFEVALAPGRAKALGLLTDYHRKKEAAERKAREDEARQARAKAQEAPESHEAQDEATIAEQDAAVSTADLSRSRGTKGSVASLSKRWVHEIEDAKEMDLNQLVGCFALPELDKAIRAYIKYGGRELKGVRIFETTQTRVR